MPKKYTLEFKKLVIKNYYYFKDYPEFTIINYVKNVGSYKMHEIV